MKWIDRIPLPLLIIAALYFSLAPFMPEPHLWEKSKMLINGDLTKGIDIADFFMHSSPLLLLIIRLFRIALKKD